MSEAWIDVAAADDVPEEGTLLVSGEGRRICLYKLDDEVFASDDLCTHGNASLSEGFIFDGKIECPFHQGLFDIRTGKAVGAPCETDLKVYPVRIECGRVSITLANDARGTVQAEPAKSV